MSQNPLPPGLLTAEEVLAAIRIPDNVGLDYGSVRVHVFDRASRRAIGVAMYDKTGVANFVRKIDTVGSEFAIQADVLEGNYALRVDIPNLEAVPMLVTATALLSDGSTEAVPEGQLVTWYASIEFPNGEVWTRTEFNAPANDFELIDFAWPNGKLTINVGMGHRLGAYVVNKQGDSDLEFVIDVALLNGLFIPDDFGQGVEVI